MACQNTGLNSARENFECHGGGQKFKYVARQDWMGCLLQTLWFVKELLGQKMGSSRTQQTDAHL